mmetsp:Transcript_28078/g.36793  ORF Transcript_28078/g.36793 Transcript_28078/m.36793 type:complete len:514 (-) Transcript_28078:164-1705(-)
MRKVHTGKKEETTPLLSGSSLTSRQIGDNSHNINIRRYTGTETEIMQFPSTNVGEGDMHEKSESGKDVLGSALLTTSEHETSKPRSGSVHFRGRSRTMSADLDVFDRNDPENGKPGTIFLLLNTMIGSGILNQPQVFSEAGIIGTLILYLIGGYTIHLGLILLIETGLKHQKLGFTELSNYAFGRKGDLVTDIAVVFSNFGGLMSYLTVVGGQICDMAKDVVGIGEDDQSWYVQEYTILPMITVMIILPLCLTRQFGHFVCISYLSISAITAVILCVLIAGPAEGREFQSDPLVWISVAGMCKKFGSVIFAMACAYAAFHAFISMKVELQTTGIWSNVTSLSIVIGGMMCMVTGLAGYINFRNGTDGDILDNFQGPYFYFFKILLVVHLILYIPLDFVVMRHSLCKIFGKDAIEMPTVQYSIVTTCLLGFTVCIVILFFYAGLSEGDAFGHILDITGGVGNSILGFVLPGAIYMKLTPDKDHKRYRQAKYLMIWGIIVMIMVTVATIIEAATS